MKKGYEHAEGFLLCEDCAEDTLEINELKETKETGTCIDCKRKVNE